jgi:DNA repair ATPase RecN
VYREPAHHLNIVYTVLQEAIPYFFTLFMFSTIKPFISIGLVGASFLISYVAFAQVENMASATDTVPSIEPVSTINERSLVTLTPRAQERIINLSANMSNRIEAMEERLSRISTRLESRLSIMTAAGNNTQAAAQQLAEANQRLSEVRVRLTTIDADVINAVTAENPVARIIELQRSYRTMATTLRNVHTELVATLNLLKQSNSTPVLEADTNTEAQ